MSSPYKWTSIKLGELVDGYRGVSYQPHDLLSTESHDAVTLLRANNIQNGRLTFGDIQIVPKYIVKEEQLLSLGDIAVCMSNGSKHLVGKSAQYEDNLIGNATVGAFCSIFRTKNGADSDYVKQIFHSAIYQAHIDYSLAGSAINNLKNSDIASLKLKVPPKAARQKIANILQTIDQTIEKTEALIEKYQLIKAGLMHDLFTRGIGADGKLRPPREEAPELYQETLIGWIPKEWEFSPISDYVSSTQYGISTGLNSDSDGIPVLRMNNIQNNCFDVSNLKYTSDPEAYKLRLKAGDVLYNRTNSMEHVGKTAIWRNELNECSFASYLVRLNIIKTLLLPEYFSYWMIQKSSQNVLRRYATPAVQQVNINPTNLQRVIISIPSKIKEQIEISRRIDAASKKVTHENDSLHKLKKQKSGLMHDLLTGKVPVKVKSEPQPEPSHV